MCTFEVHFMICCVWNYDVWTTDLGFCPFHCHACISYLSFTIFFSWSVNYWGSLGLWLGYFFYSRDPRFMSLIDLPWFVKFSKMANFNFRESWFGFVFISWDSCTGTCFIQKIYAPLLLSACGFVTSNTPLPFKIFVYKRCSK